jgi:cysteinyl-tRNA synthetase
MVSARVLNCSKMIDNYYLCINEKVAGFAQRIAEKGDIIYIVVKVDKVTVCGARGILDAPTDYKPWEDADKYVQCFNIINLEYCQPFAINIVKQYEGKYWGAKILQMSKTIKNETTVDLLNNTFNENKINNVFIFDEYKKEIQQKEEDSNNSIDTEEICEENNEKLDIMGTFQTIKFKNETDKVMGLEGLVSDNFYNLFTHFQEEDSILISDNRKFKTTSIKNSNKDRVIGIETIPDAIMIIYNKNNNSPFKVNLIEYECYGEGKLKSKEKFEYFNGHIIPQLMRFASNFSIVTDNNIRRDTINNWTDKIIEYVNENENLRRKIKVWMENIYPNIKEREVDRKFEKELCKSFEISLRITLIIDELTQEQKDTLQNVIKSFKLDDNKEIDFKSYIVRLEQKIGIVDKEARFALSFQE